MSIFSRRPKRKSDPIQGDIKPSDNKKISAPDLRVKKEKESLSEKKTPSGKITSASFLGTGHGVLIRPRITEKASDVTTQNVYVFNVMPGANKQNIKKAIHEQFKVTPIKIAITKVPSKRKFVRGKWGVSSGGKKAYVYLKEGDSIEVI